MLVTILFLVKQGRGCLTWKISVLQCVQNVKKWNSNDPQNLFTKANDVRNEINSENNDWNNDFVEKYIEDIC